MSFRFFFGMAATRTGLLKALRRAGETRTVSSGNPEQCGFHPPCASHAHTLADFAEPFA